MATAKAVGTANTDRIGRIEECGRTCRNVTSTLTNDGTAASDVTVYTHAGNGVDGDGWPRPPVSSPASPTSGTSR
ncbi:hypothetical protein DU484_17065 [Haloplanus rubicundus]|uniref:Uncharacterized protein n=1 Tax=Haloplanus rubicundus TaxID=1547898 RepID=A0A345EGV4_9EURY|nr:hypothetical protein DU484_17065 [Haloplanus rubicundus]